MIPLMKWSRLDPQGLWCYVCRVAHSQHREGALTVVSREDFLPFCAKLRPLMQPSGLTALSSSTSVSSHSSSTLFAKGIFKSDPAFLLLVHKYLPWLLPPTKQCPSCTGQCPGSS